MGVIIYIYAFLGFLTFRPHFLHAITDDDIDKPKYNSYCDTLFDCYFSTLNNGLRSSGGVGDVLLQTRNEDVDFWDRYFYDFSFNCFAELLHISLVD